MPFSIGPLAAFRDMLDLTLLSVGMKSPMHDLLVGTIINVMALLAASGQQARFHGTTHIKDILTVSDEVVILSMYLGINVRFRFNNILEIPLGVIADGHLIGFESFYIYFKNKPVSPEELQRAQVLFNFFAIARHFANLLGPQGVSELVEDFKSTSITSELPDRKVTQTRSRHGLPSHSATRMVHAAPSRQPLIAQDINHNTTTFNSAPSKGRGDNMGKRNSRLKRQARIWNNENAFLVAETERRERDRLKIRAGFI